jgi:hypothetical protein
MAKNAENGRTAFEDTTVFRDFSPGTLPEKAATA